MGIQGLKLLEWNLGGNQMGDGQMYGWTWEKPNVLQRGHKNTEIKKN
jgi:hypothetical protein